MLRVTLRGLFAHKVRFALTGIAVMVGVAFVVGSITLTESVRAQFNTLFEDINAGVDLTVRGVERFEGGNFGPESAPTVAEETRDIVLAVPGVAEAEGNVGGFAMLIDAEGEALEPQGPPLGFNWFEDSDLGTTQVDEGRGPVTDDEIAVDLDAAADAKIAVGDTVSVITPLGVLDYELVGTLSFGENNNALVGATLTLFTTDEAQRLFNLEGRYQSIAVGIEPGADVATVQAAIQEAVGDDLEVVTTEVVVQETQEEVGFFIDIFQNVLLGFAYVTLFVSGFLIFNTFKIVVGQRIRELALLRALGASRRQIVLAILGEALVVGLIASVAGFLLGLVVATLLNAVIGSAGFGPGNTPLKITWQPFFFAIQIGLMVTLLSALWPALRSMQVPPVAAMREGFRFSGMSLRTRSIIGLVVTGLGALLIFNALFGGASGIAILAGMAVGAVMVFLGTAALSPLFSTPVVRTLGYPFSRMSRVGRLATENAARDPQRTSSTAAALMIGLALVSMALVLGESIKASFGKALETAITADWYVDGNFVGFSPAIAEEMGDLDEVDAVTGGRFGEMVVDGDRKDLTAVDFAALNDLFRLDLVSGEVTGDPGLIVHEDPATDLDIHVGDTVPAIFGETGEVDLTVVAIHTESSILGNWIIDLDTYDANFTERIDSWLAARTAEGVSEADARAALEPLVEDYPQLELQNREEFQQGQEDQLNTVLIVVNVFLFLSIIVALIGIVNTLALAVFERTRELGLLRAVGETRKQVWAMVTMEAVLVAVFGAILGVTIGVAFGLAIAAALPEDFISTLTIPVEGMVNIVVTAAVLGVIAAVYPAWRASRLNVLEAVAHE